MTIEEKLGRGVSLAVKELYGVDTPADKVQLQETRKDFAGDLTVVVFPWVKAARKAPAVVAAEIGKWLEDNVDEVESTNAVGGFLNIVIKAGNWSKLLADIAATPDYGITTATATTDD